MFLYVLTTFNLTMVEIVFKLYKLLLYNLTFKALDLINVEICLVNFFLMIENCKNPVSSI